MLYPLSYEGARAQLTCLRCSAVAWVYRALSGVPFRQTADCDLCGCQAQQYVALWIIVRQISSTR